MGERMRPKPGHHKQEPHRKPSCASRDYWTTPFRRLDQHCPKIGCLKIRVRTSETDYLGEELIPKLLELLKAAAPNITRVAFIHEDYSGRMKAAKAQQRSVGRHAAPLSVEPADARIGLGRR